MNNNNQTRQNTKTRQKQQKNKNNNQTKTHKQKHKGAQKVPTQPKTHIPAEWWFQKFWGFWGGFQLAQ